MTSDSVEAHARGSVLVATLDLIRLSVRIDFVLCVFA